LALEGGAIGLRGAAAELLDEEGGHRVWRKDQKHLHREHGGHGDNKEKHNPV
jgi:hypothetical protein